MARIERQRAVESCYPIPGWCFPRELGAIYDLCAGSRFHLEIGTFCGRSLYAAAASVADGARVVAIDPMAYDESTRAMYNMPSDDWPLEVFAATCKALSHYRPDIHVEFWREPALDAASKHRETAGIGSLYLDDNHHYAEMLAHLEAWYERMAPGAVMLGHDYWAVQPGVMEAVNEFFGTRNLAFEVVSETRIWFHRVPRS